ncbi:hypothetical protein KDA00_05720 [Candidatus Saccharibacteria bacterium]|nr:hypothetical protein [Candidatus Saccharibacteria bacterium]
MREDERESVNNIRLVRLPNGKLVTQEQADKLLESTKQNNNSNSDQVKVKTTSTKTKLRTRRERKEAAKQQEKSQSEDILEVWNKQQEIKKESEKLELEYELAKKMAKELKMKLKEQQASDQDGVDESFEDLLSPRTKSLSKKLKPYVSKTKGNTKNILHSAKLTAKRYLKLGRLALKDIRSSRRKSVVAMVTLVIFMVGSVGIIKFLTQTKVSVKDVQGASDKNQIQTKVKPDFATLRPANKDVNIDLGGYAKVSPTGAASAYAYVDEIRSIEIKVTQQQLPDNFKKNPGELENLAKSYNATKLLQIDETNVYLGKKEKGPQTAVFAKDDMLVFIVADQELNDVDWVQYITNLIKI